MNGAASHVILVLCGGIAYLCKERASLLQQVGMDGCSPDSFSMYLPQRSKIKASAPRRSSGRIPGFNPGIRGGRPETESGKFWTKLVLSGIAGLPTLFGI